MSVADTGVELPPALERLGVEPPAPRAGGVKLESVDELVGALKDRGLL
jgi:hypothetical protein